jgi:hypothetical protein
MVNGKEEGERRKNDRRNKKVKECGGTCCGW